MELRQRSSLAELTRIGARMMLEVAIEEELTAFLGRDYYERRTGQEGSRSGSKPRTIKIGSGDIEINMPRVRDAGGPFHSRILPIRQERIESSECNQDNREDSRRIQPMEEGDLSGLRVVYLILDGIRLGVRSKGWH